MFHWSWKTVGEVVTKYYHMLVVSCHRGVSLFLLLTSTTVRSSLEGGAGGDIASGSPGRGVHPGGPIVGLGFLEGLGFGGPVGLGLGFVGHLSQYQTFLHFFLQT